MILIFFSFTINHGILFNKDLSFLLKVKVNFISKILNIIKLWTLAHIKLYTLSELILI